LDANSVIALSRRASKQDLALAEFLVAELSDRYGIALKTETFAKIPEGKKIILMSSIKSDLVKKYCRKNNINISANDPGAEGYILKVNKAIVLIAASDNAGAFYGLQTLRQLVVKERNQVYIRGSDIKDWPHKPFRGIRLLIPGKKNITFFKRFLKDFMALYKFNKLILEVNANMRLQRHPELNVGTIEFVKELKYSRRNHPKEPIEYYQNSLHHDAGDSGILEKKDVADIVRYANSLNIDIIPQIPSLTHCHYLLTPHPELAEIQGIEFPDTYCPSKPQSYELLFDVLDEYIDVIKPKIIHIGHDDWRIPWGVCTLCKDKEPAELLAQDINKIYNYLNKKNVKVAMWGDHLLESVYGKGLRKVVVSEDYTYSKPGALSDEQVVNLIPKNILVFNRVWQDNDERWGVGENNELKLQKMGFNQVFGNFAPDIKSWPKRSSKNYIIGGAPSSWAGTTEFNFGKDLMYEFLGCANLLWSTHQLEHLKLLEIVQTLMPQVRSNLSGKTEPSNDNNKVEPVEIAPYFNVSYGQKIDDEDENPSGLYIGMVRAGNKIFNLVNPKLHKGKYAIMVGTEGKKKNILPLEIKGIKVGKDVSSLIFLHACAKPMKNKKSDSYVYNYADTAGLLGHYEIIYEDGFVETIPIRYGVNILEWDKSGKNYCYGADIVNCAASGTEKSMNFYAFEWTNPRFGRNIKNINLKGSKNFLGYDGELIQNNAVVLLALSATQKRPQPEVKLQIIPELNTKN